ncbi:MAG: PAS domain S-box protein, partial [Anaerolineales bacterium]|nr:PAS domain S-box protein [Anaerolineales bacterium]
QEIGRIGRWDFDIDTQKITWSDQVFKLFERDPSLGEPTPEEEATYYPPKDSAMLQEYSRRSIEEGKSFEYDVQVLLPSEKTSYMTAAMRPITDESGRVIKLVGVVQDITDRKRAEQELEDIFNLSPDMVGVFTTEGKLLKVNPAWEEILGYKPNELLDSGWTDLVHPDDVGDTNKEVEKQLEGSSVVNFINRYKSKDGSYKTLEWQATYATEGIVHATARDVTEHMHMQAKLRTSEAIFKGIYSQAPVGIELFDAEGKLIDVNQECLDIFGVGHVEEIMGFRLFEDPNVSEDAKIQLRKGAPVDYESEFDFDLVKKLKLYKTTKSGKCFLQVQITPYVISGFDEKGYVVHVQDITERKEAEQAIQNAAQQWKITFDAVTDGLMVLDTEQRITRTNQAMVELFPEHTDTMIGKY